MIYQFTTEEIGKCLRWANHLEKQKGQWDRDSWVKQRNKKGDSEFLSHFQSKKAEVAVSKTLNAQMDWKLYKYGDTGKDLILSNGQTVDVKWIGNPRYGFRTKTNKVSDFSTEYGVLVRSVGSNTSACSQEILGYIPKDLFKRKAELKNFGYGYRWVVEQPLEDFRELFAISCPNKRYPQPTLIAVQAWAAAGLCVSQDRIDSHNAMLNKWRAKSFSLEVEKYAS